MVTKAGVPAHKILMGVATYGRSFKMTQPGCWGEMCTFIGGESPAKKGRCTDTGGYLSNAEIFEIAASESRVTLKWTDTKTRANYLVYDSKSSQEQPRHSKLTRSVQTSNGSHTWTPRNGNGENSKPLGSTLAAP